MNNIEYKTFADLKRFVRTKDIVKALVLDGAVFLMLGGSVVIIFLNIIFMMIRYLLPGLTILYIILVGISFYTKKYFEESLQNTKDLQYMNFKNIRYILTIFYSIFILICMVIIFLLFA